MGFKFKNEIKEENKNNAPALILNGSKEIEINGCKFLISKMPCLMSQEVLIRIGQGLLPMINQYQITEDMAVKMLSRCQRIYGDKPNVPLISKEIIENHIPDFQTLMLLEKELLELNYGFFDFGSLLNFLSEGLSLAESKLSKMLTDLLDRLYQAEKQP